MTHTVSIRVPDALNDALEAVARDAETSKSEIARNYLSDAVIDSEAPIPDHLETEIRREELKRKNRLTWQRIHFPSNVADRFRRAFEQGDLGAKINPGAVDEIKEIHTADAELLFEDDPERREAAVEYVAALADHAREAADASEFDALDPEEMFSNYSGVERSRDKTDADIDLAELEEEARLRLEKGPQRHASPRIYRDRDPSSVVSALSNEYGVPEELAREAVEAASGRSTNGHHEEGDGE